MELETSKKESSLAKRLRISREWARTRIEWMKKQKEEWALGKIAIGAGLTDPNAPIDPRLAERIRQLEELED